MLETAWRCVGWCAKDQGRGAGKWFLMNAEQAMVPEWVLVGFMEGVKSARWSGVLVRWSLCTVHCGNVCRLLQCALIIGWRAGGCARSSA